MNMPKNQPRTLWGWAMYDWANSVFSLTIATAVFPIYYQATTPSEIELAGHTVKNTALYEYAVSLAFFLIAFLSPILSGIADYRGNKKNYMKFFVWMGALSCMAMFWFQGPNVWLGIITLIISTIGFAGSLVYYNSYLPDIATPDRFDALSAKGFSLGYAGSVILLIFNLLMIQKPDWFGMADSGTLPSRIAFLSVGIWWIAFSQITFRRLPPVRGSLSMPWNKIIGKGYQELRNAYGKAREDIMLKRFLLAFFVYNMGVQTVMYLATLFGKDTLKIETGDLIITVLIIQLIAIPGAWVFSKISTRFSNVHSLLIAVFIWIGICVFAYFIPENKIIPFFALGAVVGVVMGGIQSTSRATYAKLLPGQDDTASYFSLYEFAEKTGIALGTLCYGVIDHITRDMRNSVIVLIIFFVVGFVLLLRIKDQRLLPGKSNNDT
jgi:MFS transporter, UMF1 family